MTQSILNLVNTSINANSESEDKWIKVSAIENGDYIRFNICTNQLASLENNLDDLQVLG